MGNSGSNEVTLEKEADDFIQTGDGIKLSSNLVERMSSGDGDSDKGSTEMLNEDHWKVKEAVRLAKECKEILDEREKQISELNEKWQTDLENERNKHSRFYELSLEEFEKSAKETEEKFRKPTLKPICENLQNLLVDCYKNNPNRTLECSQHVKGFRKCVADTKESLLQQSKGGA